MKIRFTLIALLAWSVGLMAQSPQNLYNFRCVAIGHDTIDMSQYAGKKVMIVNVASFCTYTREFAPLSRLDSAYGAKYNFAVVGFPCNDFGNQGGSDSDIIQTCTGYNVNFQIMSNVQIVTGDTAPIYKWLQRGDLNGVGSHHVTWNFNKFLIDRQGNWVQWYDSPTDPLDPAITNWIIEDSASLTTGVNDITATNDLIHLRSANPATDHISLDVNSDQPIDIALYSIDGRMIDNIYSGNVAGAKNISYPVASLPVGVYTVRATSGSAQQVLRCVVSK